MKDRIEPLRHSVIQHGPLNRRIYVMKLHGDDVPGILGELDELADVEGYEKILVKVPVSLKSYFEKSGYIQEACIPGFFMGKESMAFMGKFPSKDRMIDEFTDQYQSMMSVVRQKAKNPCMDSILQGPEIIRCGPEDADEISSLYERVFESYPFPIYDPDFLRDAMDSHVDYFAVRYRGKLVAAAASEKDSDDLSVEMTDFATLPEWEGYGLASRLLSAMESDMAKQNMITAYSISRAISYGMNIALGKLGYAYGGLLTNNTNIGGRIESMTVWHKQLNDP